MTRPKSLGYQPSLDGLRGLAVAAVLAYHVASANGLAGFGSVTKGGFLGVSAFLTLSGFLITSLLLLEYDGAGYIRLDKFWGRRLRRLLPAALLTLLVVAIVTPLLGTANQLKTLPGEIWACLAYVANWRFIATGSDYAATFQGAPSPLKHFWSLAVEEQSYLLLPILVAIGSRFFRGRTGVTAIFATITLASTAAMLMIGGGAYSNRVYMGTDTRVAELTIGALLAVFMTKGTSAATSQPNKLPGIARVAGPVALLLMIAAWATTDIRDGWLYRGGFQLHALATAIVIYAVMQPFNPLRGVLSARALVALGRISYGLYLFHWPILRWARTDTLHLPPALTAVVQLLLTLVAALVSYRYFELPIREQRWRISRSFSAAVVGVAAVALIAFALPEPSDDEVLALTPAAKSVVPTTAADSGQPAVLQHGETKPAPPQPVRVMVVGDSFAISVAIGLQKYAEAHTTLAVLNDGIVGCGFGRGGMNRGIGLEREWPEDCKQRETTFVQGIESFKPEVVLVAGGMWDVTDRRLQGTSTWTHIGQPKYDSWLVGELQYYNDFFQSRGIKVAWMNAPDWHPVYNPEMYMAPPPYSEAKPGRSTRYNQVLDLALAARPETQRIDILGWLNAQPGGQFSPKLRIDGVHFSLSGTEEVANWLAPELIRIGRS